MPEPLLTVDDIAADLKVSRRTVLDWNYKGTGPTRIRIGKHIRYPVTSYEKWKQARIQ